MSDQQHKPVISEQSSILDQTPSRSQAFKETEIATTPTRMATSSRQNTAAELVESGPYGSTFEISLLIGSAIKS
jgi:hypothetical protein